MDTNNSPKRQYVLFRKWRNLLRDSKDTFTFGGAAIIWLPLVLMLIIGCFLLLQDFDDPTKDTTHITNIGFAVLAGISSLSFTWAGKIEQSSDRTLHDEVVRMGEVSFHAALVYIIASGLKYIYIHIDAAMGSHYWFGERIIRFTYIICFFMAFEKTIFSITGLNKLLYRKSRKKNEN
ncbi:hypothetical protein J2T02_002031 [Chitinophaga terrae (ex Kim and Jung 2007)]|uniref:hypothetical protein n=1 Tax=Chitinophaga terrae (ex Kim and Jung 2007) TaxID=408074 RepID=UPI00278179BA|nr:hypothetical protein [Chitinophaga terrae (ex Kim and Jung 2007)]MDQ0106918.1 hypothetical protein [Chitinophaga terrae (ex Kim and Jung 2007)]